MATRPARALIPPAIALLLALMTLPVVAASLPVEAEREAINGRWVVAASASIPAALVAGMVGARVVRWNVVVGISLTVTLAWIVAIACLPLLPSLLGQHISLGRICIDECGPMVRQLEPDTGLWLLLLGGWLLGPLAEPVAFGVLVLGVIVWTCAVRWLDRRVRRSFAESVTPR